jgi:hypothetical protein
VQRNPSVQEAELAQCGVEDVEAEALLAQEASGEAQDVVRHAVEASVEDEVDLAEALVLDAGLQEEEALSAVVVVVSAVVAEGHKTGLVTWSARRSGLNWRCWGYYSRFHGKGYSHLCMRERISIH